MALKGSIDEFSLLDIFRLVGWAKKTGQLIVTSEDKEGRISFEQGLVCFAITPHNRIPIGPRLINADLITKEKLEEALELQQGEEPQEKLGEILIEQNLIKQDELEEFLQEQIQDALFEILYWTNGHYHFESSADIGQENFGISFAVEYVIDKVEKRKVEWKQIKEVVPSTQLLVRICEGPGKEKQEIVLTPLEWRLIYILRQEQSVVDLREKCQLTLFKLCKTLKNMLTKNLVELVDQAEEESRETNAIADNKRQDHDKSEELGRQEEPEEPTLEVIEEKIGTELEESHIRPHAGGKYITDLPEETIRQAMSDNDIPAEWSRYLRAPKRSR